MAEANAKVAVLPTAEKSAGSAFNARGEVQSTQTSELVIALCGPIGSDIHSVGKKIRNLLQRDFGYDYCEIIRLSSIIREHLEQGVVLPSDEYGKIKKLIEQGDILRKKHGSGVLAEIAISQIAFAREKVKRESGSKIHKPSRVCHIIDSIKNQEELEILKAVYGDMLYFVGVFSSLGVRAHNLEKRPMEIAQIWELIDKDSGEELAHGQTVRDTFHQADFFLRLERENDTEIAARVERFLHLVLNTRILTPSYGEKAMYAAASAAGNSACLSRQVGAALTDQTGELISVGWNDVPKFGGGLYEADPTNDPSGATDQRCWNREGGTCFNDKHKSLTADLLVRDLVEGGFISRDKKQEAVKRVLKDSKLKDLIEFSRAIHAEMHAIILGCQLAGDRVKNGKLFVTTYPCHSCARHIVAAGIKEVYYIEPYRKSLATTLHDDAISEMEGDRDKVRILPFDGVAPTKFLKLFRMQPDSRKMGGKMREMDFKKALPRFEKSLEAFPKLEAIVVQSLKEKKLIMGDDDEAPK
jgi:deoxycytidylate deaminase